MTTIKAGEIWIVGMPFTNRTYAKEHIVRTIHELPLRWNAGFKPFDFLSNGDRDIFRINGGIAIPFI